MGVMLQVVCYAALSLLLLKLEVRTMIPVQVGRIHAPEVHRDESLQLLRAVTAVNDNEDPCLFLDPYMPDQEQKAQADIVCQKAVSGFNLLVSNNETPANWRNPCHLASEARCRRIKKTYCRYRCSVKLPYKPPVICWAIGQTEYQTLRRCARDIVIPQN